MPSQERHRRQSIHASRIIGLEAPALSSANVSAAINAALALLPPGRDDVYAVTAGSSWPYTVPESSADHTVILYDVSGHNGAHTLVLPTGADSIGMRVVVHVYGSLPSPWSLAINAATGDLLTGGTAITALPATRVFYCGETSGATAREWYQVLSEDPPVVTVEPITSARVVAITNLDLSGTETIDSVVLSAGEIVLPINQTTADENGLQTVSLTGWTRPSGFAPQPGDQIHIREGGIFKNTIWQLENDSAPTVDTDSQTWRRIDGRMVTIHGADANGVVPNNIGRCRYSFPNLTANRILTLPVASDGLEVLVQIEANVGATRTVSFTVASGLINNNGPITGPWASGLFVARGGNWNKMLL